MSKVGPRAEKVEGKTHNASAPYVGRRVGRRIGV